jgi:hypothetical protein
VDQKTIVLTCTKCGTENKRVLPYKMTQHDVCGECGYNFRSSGKFVPAALRECADIYEERNKVYGDNYKNFGAVWLALFPDGISTTSAEDPVSACNRLGVLIQVVSKLTRYCAQFNNGGHADSLTDLAVYAIMLQELDNDINVERNDDLANRNMP